MVEQLGEEVDEVTDRHVTLITLLPKPKGSEDIQVRVIAIAEK